MGVGRGGKGDKWLWLQYLRGKKEILGVRMCVYEENVCTCRIFFVTLLAFFAARAHERAMRRENGRGSVRLD